MKPSLLKDLPISDILGVKLLIKFEGRVMYYLFLFSITHKRYTMDQV
jgi:hypothetical protein